MSRLPNPLGHHALRLNRVLDFIDTHLDQDLSLERLADQANFSRYHFLRLFQDWNKEAPHAYVRRRRLETGASQLLYSSNSISHVASTCGFESTDGFSRAFRRYFGQAPLDWRTGRRHALAALAQGECEWPVRIARIAPLQVAYVRHVGPYGQASVAQWRQLAAWMDELGLDPLTRFGMGLDDPVITALEKCRYDACFELPPSIALPRHMPVTPIHGGMYAILPFDGAPEQSSRAWRQLLHGVMLHGRYKPAALPGFERYGAHQSAPDTESQRCELCLPLVPQTTL